MFALLLLPTSARAPSRYLCFVCGIAVYANVSGRAELAKNKAELGDETEGEMTKQDQKNLEMQEHFMASGSYGTIVMTLTSFSTIFSGYVIIGVPDEMASLGFLAFRWLFIATFAIASWLLIQAQMRNVGFKRNYASPSDIVSDRFNSKSLSAACAFIWVVQLFISITAQMYALHSIIEGLSLGKLHANSLTWGICFIVLFCEVVGGQRSVSLSDAIQAGIMLCAFFLLPFVLIANYGTWGSMVDFDCEGKTEIDGVLGGCMAYTTPWSVLHPTVAGKCDLTGPAEGLDDVNCIRAHFDAGAFAGQGTFSPDRTWHSDLNHTEAIDGVEVMQHAAINMLNFALFNGGTFGLQPYVLQKIFVAKSDNVLRKANMIMYAANFFATVPMLFVGVVYAAKLETGKSAFPAVSGDLMNKGGFSEFVAVIASCSAFAALMSTVDSMVIAANNVFTVDILKNWVMEKSTIKQLRIASLIVSPVLLFSATAWALKDKDNMNLAYLFTLASSMVWQIFPVIVISFYTDRITAYPILAGIVVGFVFAIGFAQPRKNLEKTALWIELSGWISVLANVCTVFITQFIFERIQTSWMINDDDRKFDKLSPEVLKQYGPARLTAKEINEVYLKGCTVPYSTRLNKIIGVLCVIIAIISCPWYGEAYSDQKVSGGFPAWALTQFLLYMTCCAAQIFLVYSWKPADDEIPGVDADVPVGEDGSTGLIDGDNNATDFQTLGGGTWETAEQTAGKTSKSKGGSSKPGGKQKLSAAQKARLFQRQAEERHAEKSGGQPSRPTPPAAAGDGSSGEASCTVEDSGKGSLLSNDEQEESAAATTTGAAVQGGGAYIDVTSATAQTNAETETLGTDYTI